MAERSRVGLMIPSSNTVMEPDFQVGLAGMATVHTARMFLAEATPEDESRMLDEFAPPAARDLATARPDVVVFGCTSAGALRGNAYDAELCARISEVTGVPTISVIASVRRAVAAAGARRVGVATPYVDALNQKIRQSLADDGLEVVAMAGLGIAANLEIGRVEPDTIAGFVAARLAGAGADLAFVSCTNFRAVEAIPQLRRRLGLPVVTSNQAAVDAVRAALGRRAASDLPCTMWPGGR
jgi:maleate isomerase